MTSIETGIISGAFSGGIVGGTICKSHGVPATVGGSFAGLIGGAITGWLYAMLFIGVTCAFLVLWRAIRKRADASPLESELKALNHVLGTGTFLGAIAGTTVGLTFGLVHAFVVVLILTAGFAVIAVMQCELNGHDPHLQTIAVDPDNEKDA